MKIGLDLRRSVRLSNDWVVLIGVALMVRRSSVVAMTNPAPPMVGVALPLTVQPSLV